MYLNTKWNKEIICRWSFGNVWFAPQRCGCLTTFWSGAHATCSHNFNRLNTYGKKVVNFLPTSVCCNWTMSSHWYEPCLVIDMNHVLSLIWTMSCHWYEPCLVIDMNHVLSLIWTMSCHWYEPCLAIDMNHV